jgi:hypothetical protein
LETLDLLCKAFGLPPEELGFGNIIAAKRRTTEGAIPRRNDETFSEREAPQEQVQQDDHTFAYQVEQIKKNLDEMTQAQDENGEGLSRKKAVALLVSTPSAIFGLIQDSNELLLCAGARSGQVGEGISQKQHSTV